eukprot:5488557-Pyramimonas_sp.AAC.1
MIERRSAILRRATQCIERQRRREGLGVSMPDLLSEAALAGKSPISYGGGTPGKARSGRQPRMLSDTLALPDNAVGAPHISHWPRGIALQRTALVISRINRASKTNATVAGQAPDYKPGELVDSCRGPSTKSVSGWMERTSRSRQDE